MQELKCGVLKRLGNFIRRVMLMNTIGSVKKRQFTIAEYYKMADTGILKFNEKLELLEGEIYTMSPIGAMHAYCVDFFDHLFNSYAEQDPTIIVRVQNPVQLPDNSEPEPDIAIVKNRSYKKQHPIVEDVYQIIEVSESTYSYDKGIKLPLYAKHSIPEVWIVDTNKNRIEVFVNPIDNQYKNRMLFSKGKMSPTQFLNAVIDLDILFAE